jgi:hypothetical protein
LRNIAKDRFGFDSKPSGILGVHDLKRCALVGCEIIGADLRGKPLMPWLNDRDLLNSRRSEILPS